MRGMQQAKYDERALSLEELSDSSLGYRLPKGDWSMSVIDSRGNRTRKATVIEVVHPEDVSIINALFPEAVDKETRVDHRYQGVLIGNVGRVKDFPKEIWKPKTASTGLEDKVDDNVYEVSDDQIIDIADGVKETAPVYEMSDFRKTSPFNQVDLYDEVFRQNQHLLGMSIDRYTRKLKSGEVRDEHRYRQKKSKGVAGGWVSKDYVFKVFDALKEYKTLAEKDDLSSLRRIRSLAKQYFTREAYQEANARLHQKVYDSLLARGGMRDIEIAKRYANRFMDGEQLKKAGDVADFLMLKESVEFSDRLRADEIEDPRTATKAYSHLIRSHEPENVSRALEIAKMYLTDDVVRKTQKFHERVTKVNQKVQTTPGSRIGNEEVTRKVNITSFLQSPPPVPGSVYRPQHSKYSAAV